MLPPIQPHTLVLRSLEIGLIWGLGSESSYREVSMPQHIKTMCSQAGSLPQAPDKLAHECAETDMNKHTDSWPPGLPSSILKLQG